MPSATTRGWLVLAPVAIGLQVAWNALLMTPLAGGLWPAHPYWVSVGIVVGLALVGMLPPFEWIMVYANGGRRLEAKAAERLERIVERLRGRTGFAGPVRLWGLAVDVPNAFAMGRSAVMVTRGLLALPDDEVEAVLAHELGHLAGGKGLITQGIWSVTMVGGVVGWLVIWLIGAVLRMTAALTSEITVFGVVFLKLVEIALGVVLWVANRTVWLTWLAWSRQEEYAADGYAAAHGYGRALASALVRMEGGRIPRQGLLSLAQSTHPRTADRVKRLEAAAG